MTRTQKQALVKVPIVAIIAITLTVIGGLYGYGVSNENRISTMEQVLRELCRQTEAMHDNQTRLIQNSAKLDALMEILLEERAIRQERER